MAKDEFGVDRSQFERTEIVDRRTSLPKGVCKDCERYLNAHPEYAGATRTQEQVMRLLEIEEFQPGVWRHTTLSGDMLHTAMHHDASWATHEELEAFARRRQAGQKKFY